MKKHSYPRLGVYLTERHKKMLAEICEHHQDSVSNIIREFIAIEYRNIKDNKLKKETK